MAKKKSVSRKHALYGVSGGKLTRKNRFCPKCGAGIFLAQHKDRRVCGTCQYVEMTAN